MTLNLSDNTYKSLLKTDQYSSYINVNSNHPEAIIKQVPKAIHMRIRRLSANEEIFQDSSKIYKEALKRSGFRKEFTYHEEKILNEKNLYINKENTKYIQKKLEKGKLYGLTPFFVD